MAIDCRLIKREGEKTMGIIIGKINVTFEEFDPEFWYMAKQLYAVYLGHTKL